MQDFDKITIQEMSKHDMLLIIKALQYTGQETNIAEFIELKNDLIRELSVLSNIPEELFLDFLKKETQSL